MLNYLEYFFFILLGCEEVPVYEDTLLTGQVRVYDLDTDKFIYSGYKVTIGTSGKLVDSCKVVSSYPIRESSKVTDYNYIGISTISEFQAKQYALDLYLSKI